MANNTIGGPTAGERNVISGNDGSGVHIEGPPATGNKALGNSIFNNTKLGIDLGLDDAVTANDVGDGDTGSNNLQNFPVLTCVTSAGGATTVGGTLNSLATTSFRIEFFVNDACDASGNGEGHPLLGMQNVTTDGSGDVTFSATGLPAVAVGKFITATATRLDAMSNPVETSEFSKCLAVSAPPTLAISDVTMSEGNSGTTNFEFTVTLTNAQTNCLPVTVAYATANDTATADSDYTTKSGTLTLSPPHASNSVTQTITVAVTGDTTVEPDETFFVNLTTPINATISKAQGVGTITNDDLPPFKVEIGDPLLCLTAGGLVGVTATVTNSNPASVNAVFTAALPTTLNGLPGTGLATVNPGGVNVTASAVTWSGTIPVNTAVTITYKTQLAANSPPNQPVCINSNVVSNGGPRATVQECKVLNCPTGLANAPLSDEKAGALLVFPYFTSKAATKSDTRLSVSNIGEATTTAHLFFIDGQSCQVSDVFLCLTPNATYAFKASEYDSETTGWLLAVAVDGQGRPTQYNGLIGNAFVQDGASMDNYGAESFRANSPLLATYSGNTATLFLDNQSYDAVPNQFAVEVQSPLDAPGQQIVTVGLQGNLTTGQFSGAAQVGTGLVFNEKEAFASFSGWLLGACQARATIATNAPCVPNGLGSLLKSGQSGTLKFNVGGGVGLLLSPQTNAWRGIRTLHKTQLTATTLTIPVFVPVC
ncbi:MAG: Calx-beta domain-containing protein [Blastocatellia bacterium]